MHDARAICVYIVYIMYVSRVYIVYFRVFCVCRRIPSCAAPSPVTSSHHVIAGVPDGSDTPTKALQISQMLLQYCISCIYCVTQFVYIGHAHQDAIVYRVYNIVYIGHAHQGSLTITNL